MTEGYQNEIFMGQSSMLIENDNLNGEKEIRNETNFFDGNQNKRCKEELWRPLILMYSSEIFLSGHPVPAFVSFIFNQKWLFQVFNEKLPRKAFQHIFAHTLDDNLPKHPRNYLYFCFIQLFNAIFSYIYHQNTLFKNKNKIIKIFKSISTQIKYNL